MSILAGIKERKAEIANRKPPVNLLMRITGQEENNGVPMLLGVNMQNGDKVRLSLASYTAKDSNRSRVEINEMMSEGYKNQVHVGGVVLADKASLQQDGDVKSYVAQWLTTFQYKSPNHIMKDREDKLKLPMQLSELASKKASVSGSELKALEKAENEVKSKLAKLNNQPAERMALSGPATVYLSEGRNGRSPRIDVSVYKPAEAVLIEKAESLDQITTEIEKLLADDEASAIPAQKGVVLRIVDREGGEGVKMTTINRARIKDEDGDYVWAEPKDVVDRVMNSNSESIAQIKEILSQHPGHFDFEAIPTRTIAMGSKSIADTNFFDNQGRIIKNPEGSALSGAERLRDLYHSNSEIRDYMVLDTHMSVGFYNDGTPLLTSFAPAQAKTTAYAISNMQTDNFTPNEEFKFKPEVKDNAAKSPNGTKPASDDKPASNETKPAAKTKTAPVAETAPPEPSPELPDEDDINDEDLDDIMNEIGNSFGPAQ